MNDEQSDECGQVLKSICSQFSDEECMAMLRNCDNLNAPFGGAHWTLLSNCLLFRRFACCENDSCRRCRRQFHTRGRFFTAFSRRPCANCRVASRVRRECQRDCYSRTCNVSHVVGSRLFMLRSSNGVEAGARFAPNAVGEPLHLQTAAMRLTKTNRQDHRSKGRACASRGAN